jgi:exonuclease III
MNINDSTSQTRVAILEAFVRLHELDILLLQEVTHAFATDLYGYNNNYSISTTRRGAAILSRHTITITNVSKLISGRALAATLGTLSIINIYAHPGTAKKKHPDTAKTREGDFF